MSEDKEKKVAEEEQATAEPAAKKGKKRLPIILAVIVVVVAIAGVGFWKWHEQPTFCNAFCHETMDEYVATYYAEPGAAATDKWGNEVANSNSMMVVMHAQAGVNCLGCHVPSLGQQIGEVMMAIQGSYVMPLEEQGTESLLRNAGNQNEADTFCLKPGCHDMITREVLTEATAEMDFNPHRWQHGEIECSECHKSHRASVFYCTQCHTEAEGSVPEGWLTYAEGQAIEDAAMAERDAAIAAKG